MSDRRSPRVSVCIPVYNCEAYIGAAVDSALAQTYGDFELLVLDNCSTDATPRILAGYKDPRLKVSRNAATLDYEDNWNESLRGASGEYVKVLCADDLLYPDCLARQVKALEQEGVSLVCSGRDVINPEGKALMRRAFASRELRLPGPAAVRRSMRAGTNTIGEPAAVLFRRSALEKAGPFSAEFPYVIDLNLWIRLLLQGDLYSIPEPLCAFRVSGGSWSVQIYDTQAADFTGLMEAAATDPRYGLTAADRISGRLRARINAALRMLFYKFFV